LGFGQGKYKCMKINPKTNMPYHIPSVASEKLNVRLKPAQKWAIKKLGIQNRQSMSKAVLEIFDFYFENAISSNFWNDIYSYSNQKSGKKPKIQIVTDFLGNLLKCP
jgi:hypothetical protein